MAAKNETTKAVFEILTQGDATITDLMAHLECSRSNVAMVLGRLRKQGRVDVESVVDGEVVIRAEPKVTRPRVVNVYHINDRGRGRLDYLREVSA